MMLNLERVALLLEAVENLILLTSDLLHPGLDAFKIRAWFQSQLQGGHHALLVEQVLSKAQTGDDITLVVLTLID